MENETKATPAAQVPPKFTMSLIFPVAFLVAEIIEISDYRLQGNMKWVNYSIIICSIIYYLVWVWRLHSFLNEITKGEYIYKPTVAVLGHLIPIYNIFWEFKWTNAVVDLINQNLPDEKQFKHNIFGSFLVGGFALTRVLDASLGLFIAYGACIFLVRKLTNLCNESIKPINQLNTQEIVNKDETS